MYVYDKTVHIRQKTSQLIDFVISTLRLYPKESTANFFTEPSFTLPENQQIKMQKLFRMLVHTSTLTNRNYRLKDKHGRYMSQQEDYINALELMKDLVLYFDVKKGKYEHEILALMQVLQEQKGDIKSKDLQELSGYSKSSCKRIITLFLDRGWIIRKGGNRKQGYTYILTE